MNQNKALHKILGVQYMVADHQPAYGDPEVLLKNLLRDAPPKKLSKVGMRTKTIGYYGRIQTRDTCCLHGCCWTTSRNRQIRNKTAIRADMTQTFALSFQAAYNTHACTRIQIQSNSSTLADLSAIKSLDPRLRAPCQHFTKFLQRSVRKYQCQAGSHNLLVRSTSLNSLNSHLLPCPPLDRSILTAIEGATQKCRRCMRQTVAKRRMR